MGDVLAFGKVGAMVEPLDVWMAELLADWKAEVRVDQRDGAMAASMAASLVGALAVSWVGERAGWLVDEKVTWRALHSAECWGAPGAKLVGLMVEAKAVLWEKVLAVMWGLQTAARSGGQGGMLVGRMAG